MDKANGLLAGLAIAAIVALLVGVDAVWLICMIILAVDKVQDMLAKCEQLAIQVDRIIDSLHNLFRMMGVQAVQHPHWNPQHARDHANSEGADKFTLAEITLVTNDFAHVIGQGDSGEVYKGKLHDGRRVAVKRLQDGRRRRAEDTFVREIALLHPLSHENIVRQLVGSCAEEQERMLVYEHMYHGTLRDLLNDASPVAPSWRRRVQVLLGAARAIKHLHCHAVPPLIHGNVTSSNILLDRSLTPRVSGFGASVCRVPGVLSQPVDLVQTNGYADPEYRTTGRLKPATDVYSFGVVMLEVLTGKQPVADGGRTLVSWALPRIEAGKLGDVLDNLLASEPTLRQREALQRVADTAASCLFMDGDRRLAISHVVASLEQALDLIRKDNLKAVWLGLFLFVAFGLLFVSYKTSK